MQEARLTGSGAGAPCLAVDELRVAYGGVVAVDGVSLTVAPGRITVLLGANGAGKTSTQRGIGGLQRVGRGTAVSLAGRRVERLDPAARARAGLGHCLEDRHVFPRLSVEENLALGTLSARGRSPTPLAEVYALFPELEARRDVHAGKLSGGQQQERGRPLGRVRMAPSRRCGARRGSRCRGRDAAPAASAAAANAAMSAGATARATPTATLIGRRLSLLASAPLAGTSGSCRSG